MPLEEPRSELQLHVKWFTKQAPEHVPRLLHAYATRRLDLSYLGLTDKDLKGLVDCMFTHAQLQSVEEISLNGNSIEQLPPSLVQSLPKLRSLTADGNPLQQPPPAVVRQGLQAMRRYFEELKLVGDGHSLRCKLIFLGEGEAGKTSLLKSWQHKVPTRMEATERSIYLDVSTLEVQVGLQTVGLSCWDLAGQPGYSAVQQPFVVPDALYVLCVEATIKEDNQSFEKKVGRWLDGLRVRAPG